MAFVPLHRIQFELDSGVRIEIETVNGQGKLLENPPSTCECIDAEEEIEPEAIPAMCWRLSSELFEPFQLREDTDYFIDVSVPIPKSEAKTRAAINPAWPFKERVTSAFKREPSKRWREVEDNGMVATIVTGQMRLRSHAGILDLSTEFGSGLRAEVVCRKLRYFDEFKALLDSLAEKATELLLAFDTPVSASFEMTEEQSNSDAALHFIMRYLFSPDQLPAAISEIVRAPHSRLVENIESKGIEETQGSDSELIVDHLDISNFSKGGVLSRLFCGYSPRELPEKDSFETFDTPENRYCKAFLEHCHFLSQKLEQKMTARKRSAAAREATAWGEELDHYLQHGMWREVGVLGHIPENSQAMFRKRGYMEIFKMETALRLSLSLAWPHGAELSDGLVGDIRPVNQIYEYWCFFVLREALQSLCVETSGGDFLVASGDGLRIQLAKGRRSECQFEYTAKSGNRLAVHLFYNHKFSRKKSDKGDWSGSYTATFDPDYSVLVCSESGHSHWLHFDAKYRLDRIQAEEMFGVTTDEADFPSNGNNNSYERELERIHKQDDLFKMHTYRDGIFSTRGAYVLFPGDGVGGETERPRPNLFVRHPSAINGSPKYVVPSVGAFPLKPEGSGLQVQALTTLIKTTLEMISGDLPYNEELGWFGS